MSSNSFGQNKIGHKFCLPKTDPSNSRRITCAKANLLCSKLATCTHGIGKYRYDMKLTTNQNTRERKALYKLRCHKSTNLSEAIAAVRITTNIHSEYYTYNILYIYIYSTVQCNWTELGCFFFTTAHGCKIGEVQLVFWYFPVWKILSTT